MKHTITPILFTIIAIFVCIFIAKPKYGEATLLNTEIGEYKFAIEKYDAYNAKIQELILKRDSVNISDRTKLETLVPEKLDVTHALVDLEDMALQSNLFVENVEADDDLYGLAIDTGEQAQSGDSEGSQNAEIQHADATMSLIGTYEDFKNFLRITEKSLTLMDVTKLSIVQKEGGIYAFSVTFRTYALPEKIN